MNDFLLSAAGFLLIIIALGLVRIVRGPADLEDMMPEFIHDYLLEMWK